MKYTPSLLPRAIAAATVMTAFAAVTAQADFSTNFNADAATFTDNFVNTGGGNWGATEGVFEGGVATGGVGINAFNGQYANNTDLGLLSAGQFVSVSLFYYTGTLAATGSGAKVGFVGLSSSTAMTASNTGLQSSAGANVFGAGLQTAAATTVEGVTQLRWRTNTSSDGAAPTISTFAAGAGSNAFFNISNETWYRIDATFELSPTVGTLIFGATVTNYGATGETAGAVVSSFSSTANSSAGAAGIYSSASKFAAFTFASSGGAGSAIDNFAVTAVPEPSTYALAIAGFLFVLVAYRRRSIAMTK